MSAFVVDDAAIDVILDCLRAAVNQRPYFSRLYWRDGDGRPQFFQREDARDAGKLTAIGRMLLAQNARSVGVRYREGENPCALLYTYRATGREVYLRPMPESFKGPAIVANAALKNIACYEYQSCESNDWEDTEAFRFCAALKDRIAEIAVPFRECDPWGFTDRHLGREVPA
jgi:hypothetical protein